MRLLADGILSRLCDIAEDSDFLLIGEVHGAQETAHVLGELVTVLTPLGYSALAMEIPHTERDAIVAWARGETLALSRFFTHPSGDGRASDQSLVLVQEAVRHGWELLCFDDSPDHPYVGWWERDSGMADNLTAQWGRYVAGRKVLGVCGNFHSRLNPPAEPFAHLWPSFAACFQMRNPERGVRTIDVVFHGGAHYNGEVRHLHRSPAPDPPLREEPNGGHSFTLHLPEATPVTVENLWGIDRPGIGV